MGKIIINQSGFTLVELMVSIVLGLLITAAAIQLFLTGQISLNMQRAMADIQDNGNFGLNYITSDLRRANYNADKPIVTDSVNFGGIVLGDNNFPAALTNKPAEALRTKTAADASTQKTDTASDQLTIQYYMLEAGSDCEGNNIAAGNYVIQRYYIEDGNLKCDAGWYPASAPTTVIPPATTPPAYVITGFGSGGQTIIRNAEYMRILLAVSEDNAATGTGTNNQAALPVDGIAQKNLRYVATYPAGLRVRGVQIGFLMRANDSLASNSIIEDKNKTSFRVLDKDVTLVTKDKVYLRQVVTQTIALRNAIGASS